MNIEFRNVSLGVLLLLILAGCGQPAVAPPSPSPAPTRTLTPLPTLPGGGTGRIAISDYRQPDGSSQLFMMNADGSNLVSLTDPTIVISGLTWSPDGSKVAFCGYDGQDEALTILNSDGSLSAKLTRGDSCFTPAWSPDGTRFAYADASNIFVMNSDGSGAKKLTQNGHRNQSPRWSPDSSQIIYVSIENNAGDIYIMNADGSDNTNLTNSPEWEDFPVWSPDGSRIVYSVIASENADAETIHEMNADGSDKHVLVNNPDYKFRDAVTWSPDGSVLLLICESGLKSAICKTGADGSHFEELRSAEESQFYAGLAWQPDPQLALGPAPTAPPIKTALPTATAAAVSLPPAGKDGRIAFDNYVDGDFEIFVINPDGSGLVQLTNNADDDFGPYWSPDGRQIVFASDRDGNNELYTIDLTTGRQTRLTNTPDFQEVEPKWSPDGKHIMYMSVCESNCSSDLFMMDADGSNRVNLTIGHGFVRAGMWLPDGQHILLTADAGYQTPTPGSSELEQPRAMSLYSMALDGSAFQRITGSIDSIWSPVLSPDGKTIAYSGHDRHITTASLSGFSPKVLTAGGFSYSWHSPTQDLSLGEPLFTPSPDPGYGRGDSGEDNPAWSPDGSRIAFISDRDQRPAYYYLWIMDRDGSNMHQISEIEAREVVWSPVP